MTVGLYSPLPPARTGIADYSAALLAELRKHGRVEIAPRRCDAALYHMGNNRLHTEIYRTALEQPGVVVLHDAVLHHFYLSLLDERAYIDEFAYNFGDFCRPLAADFWRGRAASASDNRYFEYPMLRRIAETSRAVVVHNPAAQAAIRRYAPGARVVEIPHLAFAQPPVPEAFIVRFREQLGLDPQQYVFGIFGFLRESKRLIPVLESFARARRDFPNAALLVAGDFVSTDLARAAEPLLNQPGIVRLPFMEPEEFRLAAAAVDACINLRYPAAGETSGITIRLMSLGKPVLVTDSPECSRFPEDACIRVSYGTGERESIYEHLVLLLSMNELGRAVGLRAERHIASHHAIETIAARYWSLLCELQS